MNELKTGELRVIGIMCQELEKIEGRISRQLFLENIQAYINATLKFERGEY